VVAEVLAATPAQPRQAPASLAPPIQLGLPQVPQGLPQMSQGIPVQLLQQPTPAPEVDLRGIVVARVASRQRSDVFEQVLRASALRLPNGVYQAGALQISAGWRDDNAAPVTAAESGDTAPAPPVTDDSSGATTG